MKPLTDHDVWDRLHEAIGLLTGDAETEMGRNTLGAGRHALSMFQAALLMKADGLVPEDDPMERMTVSLPRESMADLEEYRARFFPHLTREGVVVYVLGALLNSPEPP